MPGNNSSPCRIFWMRFLRNSSLTVSTLYPLSRNSPIVRGWVVIVIPLSCYLSWGSAHMIHVWDWGNSYHSYMFLLYLKQVEPTLFYRLERESARVLDTRCSRAEASLALEHRIKKMMYTPYFGISTSAHM